jgi:Zn-dependent metalloprotease
MLPESAVDFDRTTGTPKFVRARDGFLSGPNGTGRGVSAQAGRAFAAKDPHPAVKTFLQEHRGLFGHGSEVLAAARVSRDYITAKNGLRTVVWQQELDRIPIHEGVLIAHTTRDGQLVTIASQFLPDPAAAAAGDPNPKRPVAGRGRPWISQQQAVSIAAATSGTRLTRLH